ncbi:hypothetical protein C8P68_101866 [Mucilaginibacter yixingensis]|uniref:Glycosyltransferase 2-like domain-containing protein n=1 Tax=Mucilaginibacter yixingensis TaxID=1295612 RepID=A0A2T5JGT7_9SPHI|nr:glycosyltransferase family 2 protein [Mucilaginibacter yixingensis]PTR01629.1 hypothetical protein C8P68_101866 [Mucilaginibacter yixingensis]
MNHQPEVLQRVLIIIPCYNEEAALPSLLQQLKQLTPPTGYSFQFAVINDGSVDATAQIATAAGVIILNLPINLGIGAAVQTGLLYAQQNHFSLAIQLDGDGQHPPTEIEQLLRYYEQTNASLVIGSRFSGIDSFRSTPGRRAGIGYLSWLAKLLTSQRIYDITSGFRLFDEKAIELGAISYPDEYPEPESIILFSRSGLEIGEVAVNMQARQGGRSSIRNFTSLYYCAKVTLAMLFTAIRKLN